MSRKKPRLWLHKPKRKQKPVASVPHNRTPAKSVQKSPGCTPRKSIKRLLTPKSTQKKSRKKNKVSPTKTPARVLDENVLFDEFEEEISQEAKTYIDIATDKTVIDSLSKAGYLSYLISFFHLVKQNKYPLRNLAFLLWLETVRWFSCITLSEMWYWNETKKFWRAGYRLFHGKFLTFMSGPRSEGQIVSGESERGLFNPERSKINFAVPSRSSIIQQSTTIPSALKPGVIKETLDAVARTTLTNVNMMCVDGKKVNAGLDSDSGDVDMFGFENSPTVNENKSRLDAEIQMIEIMKHSLSDQDNTRDADENDKIFSITEMIRALIYILTNRIKDGRILKQKQEYGLEKLKERAGTEWRKSKFVFAISGIQTFLFRVKHFLDVTLRNIDRLCKIGSEFNRNSSIFCSGDKLDPAKQSNLFELKEVSDQIQPIPTNLIKQRSDMWHSVRALAPVTGSSLHNAIGLRSLKEQKVHFDTRILGQEEAPRSEAVQKYLEHGIKHEQDAVATLVGKFMPFFYPDLDFFEEGCYLLGGPLNTSLIEVSPDGSLRRIHKTTEECSEDISDSECVGVVEIKCPYPKDNTVNQIYEVPKYYICQCLSEMKAMKVSKLLFVCYTKESSTFFEIKFDESLWNIIEQEANELYGSDNPSRPKRLKPITKILKEKLELFSERNITLLAEVPSVRMLERTHEEITTTSPYHEVIKSHSVNKSFTDNVADLQVALTESEECIRNGHQLSRKKATEVMAWVISNKDRQWSPELPNSLPVAFGLKDYKFSTENLRNATNYVLENCKERGIEIPLLAFDGQWYSLLVRDDYGNPLTKLQLQKDVWTEVNRLKRDIIVNSLKEVNKVEIFMETGNHKGIIIDRTETGISVSSTDHAFRTVVTNRDPKHWKDSKKKVLESDSNGEVEDKETNNIVCDWLPDDVIEQIEKTGDSDLFAAINSVSKEIDTLIKKNNCQRNDGDVHEIMDHSDTEDVEEMDLDNVESQPVRENISELQMDDNQTRSNNQNVVIPNENRNVSSENEAEDANRTTGRSDEKTLKLTQNDLVLILSRLQAGKRAEKWKTETTETVVKLFETAELMKTFTVPELDCVADVVKGVSGFEYKKGMQKNEKINQLSSIIGDGSLLSVRAKTKKISSLQSLSEKMLRSRKVPKSILNIAYAQYVFPNRLEKWQTECKVPKKFCDGHQEHSIDWYSHPEVNKATGALLCKCLDAHHLLTNLRIRTSTKGIKGISSTAWKRVANSFKTKLSPAMVEDLVDKQSNSFAQTHFSEEVEKEMLSNGDKSEAEFCRIIRRWYEAEDSPALSVSERLERWLCLREYLLRNIDFGVFPPPTQYIKGLSLTAFEGFVTGIDTKIQLYGICGPYCVRTVSSLPAETCVGVIQDMNLNNTMSVNAKDIPKIMSSVTELMTYKCDPSRGFHMKTSRSAVYPDFGGKEEQSRESTCSPAEIPGNTVDEAECSGGVSTLLSCVELRNHVFDEPERRRTKVRRKLGTVTNDPDAPPKGTATMRQSYHKCNESKVPLEKRFRECYEQTFLQQGTCADSVSDHAGVTDDSIVELEDLENIL